MIRRSRWGTEKWFAIGDGGIRVVALALDDKVDDLVMTSCAVSPKSVGMAKLQELKEYWIGRSHSEWGHDDRIKVALQASTMKQIERSKSLYPRKQVEPTYPIVPP